MFTSKIFAQSWAPKEIETHKLLWMEYHNLDGLVQIILDLTGYAFLGLAGILLTWGIIQRLSSKGNKKKDKRSFRLILGGLVLLGLGLLVFFIKNLIFTSDICC